MYNYPPDYYEGDFYNEPSEFDEKMEELKSYLMNSVRKDIKSDLSKEIKAKIFCEAV